MMGALNFKDANPSLFDDPSGLFCFWLLISNVWRSSTHSQKGDRLLILFQIGDHTDPFVKIRQFGKPSFQLFNPRCEKIESETFEAVLLGAIGLDRNPVFSLECSRKGRALENIIKRRQCRKFFYGFLDVWFSGFLDQRKQSDSIPGPWQPPSFI